MKLNRMCEMEQDGERERELEGNPRINTTKSDCYLFGQLQHIVLITYDFISKDDE